MILVDHQIRVLGIIEPFNENQLNPNSYNVRLHDEVIMYEEVQLDCKKPNRSNRVKMNENGFVLFPNRLYLGRTIEKQLDSTTAFVPMLEGRSSLARLGLTIHVSAGFGDVGYQGHWTLELCCVQPIRIYPFMEIGQLFFISCEEPEKRYTGKYQSSTDILTSLIHEELK